MADIESTGKLSRSLGFWPTFAVGVGTMIGAGIFVLPGIALTSAGPAAIFSFLLGGLISMATALSTAELATGMPRAGGEYYFISRIMGPLFGTIIGLGAWFALVFKGSFALLGMAEYMGVIFPVPIMAMGVTAGIIILFINYRGSGITGSIQNYIVFLLVTILLLFIVRGFFSIQIEYLFPFMPYEYNSVFATTALIFVSYLGIVKMAAISEEVINPSKNLPRAFVSSILVVTLLYTGVMLVITGITPMDKIVSLDTPLINAAQILGGDIGVIIIILAGFLATFSTANAAIFSCSRYPFAMARDNLIPERFVEIHRKYGTPYKAVILTGLSMMALLVLFDVEQLAKLGGTFNVLIFVLVNVSVIILRYKVQEWYKPSFKSPLFPILQIFGVVACIMLIIQMGTLPTIFAAVVIIIGIFWYYFYCGEDVKPHYNLLDILEDDKVPINVEDKDGQKVLVFPSESGSESDLLRLAESLGNKITLLNVIKVPYQTGLSAAREKHIENYDERYKVIKKKLDDYIIECIDETKCIGSVKKKYGHILLYGRMTVAGILNQMKEEAADLIIMDTPKKKKSEKYIIKKLMTTAQNHAAVLNGHYPENLKSITVAYNGKSNSAYAVFLAKKLALSTGTKIEILRIVDKKLGEKKKNEIIEDLNEIISDSKDLDIKVNLIESGYKSEDMTEILIKKCNENNLTIMGGSTSRLKLSYLGPVTTKVINKTKNPVLIVKLHKPISRKSVHSYLDLLMDSLSKVIKDQ